MGFRFRKSINLGGGFRVNISKSGIGYSWGTKGFRLTKTSKGTTRKTFSIPGTGISYVDESGKKSEQSELQPKPLSSPIENNLYDTQEIVNEVTENMVSEGLEDVLSSARKSLILNKVSNIGIVVFLLLSFLEPILIILLGLSVLLKICVLTIGRINLEYEIDEDQIEDTNKNIMPILKMTDCKKVWRIVKSSRVANKKYASGASKSVDRKVCQVTPKAVFPFKSDCQAVSLKAERETFIFLPDKLFIIQKNKIGALNYSEISTNVSLQQFIEDEKVPEDAKVISYTWKYVNKAGGPDKRFKDNKELPVCLYGEMELKSNNGLNTVFMFSNIDLK